MFANFMKHIIIDILSPMWWKGIFISCTIIPLLLFVLKKQNEFAHKSFMKITAVLALLIWVFSVLYEIYNDIWTIQDSLPLHVSWVSFLILILFLWKPKQWMFEWSIFIGIPSGFHAVITPELPMGDSNWLMFYYYFSHIFLLFIPLYLSRIRGYKVRKFAWLNSYFYVQILVLINLPLNFIIDSNYLFLREPPLAKNPFLIGDWPWYILVIECALFLHVLLLSFLFPSTKRIK
jgi:hypothetical integral membrane protein (TIGR02206 family)